MRRHMGIHQGDKPFECPHCNYCTRLKASLEQHLRVHTGEALPHRDTHTVVTPWLTEVCSKNRLSDSAV